MKKIVVNGVEITHQRLVELTKLADQAKPFYDWVEKQFQITLNNTSNLDKNLQTASLSEVTRGIESCYKPLDNKNLPLLFDGIGRPYKHRKSCYYFFAWIIRDAPQQRLSGPISTLVKKTNNGRIEAQISVLATLIFEYRSDVKTFEWQAIREIIIDRLEGSRRSLKGHEKEVIVRTALLEAIQTFYSKNGSYGIYANVELFGKQVKINNETFDVGAKLLNENGKVVRHILVPVKTRETQGGGHSHLFSRDLNSALSVAKDTDMLIVVIVAKSWSKREIEALAGRINHLIVVTAQGYCNGN
ncbi:MAG: hypothetical protein Q9P01_02235 [Anaerolineae bacterium]|nr:hypothetical protein [Anaerolineae bacterium]MDQ7033678.1 hypothetical protein [Anaerolineae bacterium]